jgi:hypothetical protein
LILRKELKLRFDDTKIVASTSGGGGADVDAIIEYEKVSLD